MAVLLKPVFLVLALPVPDPTPVAVNTTPNVLLPAPIRVKSVVPIVLIEYVVPITNEPAAMIASPYMD